MSDQIKEIAEPQVARDQHSLTTLESINEDCLRQICQYLDIIEVANLSSTCTRLQEFANKCIFPKIAKHVEIRFRNNEKENVIRAEIVNRIFESFGSFVEQLTFEFAYTVHRMVLERVLDLCTNLHSLCMKNVSFKRDYVFILYHATNSLKELKFEDCVGIQVSHGALHRFRKLEHITLIGTIWMDLDWDYLTAKFFKNTDLLGLKIDLYSDFEIKAIEKIFDQIGRSLKQLKLNIFVPTADYLLIAAIIGEKLTKLENLAITAERIVENTSIRALIQLTQLKFLDLYCSGIGGNNLNSLLQDISNCGTIEHLRLRFNSDVYDIEDVNVPPLVFKKLQKCVILPLKINLYMLFKALTKSHMPAITCFEFGYYEKALHDSLLAFIVSKKTLKFMIIWRRNRVDTFPLVLQVIEILKLSNENRPCFYLEFPGLYSVPDQVFNMEEVSKVFS